ncbi:hypothetical protein ACFP81_12620 [Deinococcus lacus]|uniref:Uncharacterized protein n=1 Tax=Deinococcus lacus TaxID=392561 RepID=A0ABW1YEQ2_9DEIO
MLKTKHSTKIYAALACLGLGYVASYALVFASVSGVFMPKNPAQRFEHEMRGHFGGKNDNFSAHALLVDGREWRVTVLNPDKARFPTKPIDEDGLPADTPLDQTCYQALKLMSLAHSYMLGGSDPGYSDYQKWRWPITVEWGWTTPGTLETKLNCRTFTAAQTREGLRQCVLS